MKLLNACRWLNKTSLLFCAASLSACATIPPYVEPSKHVKFTAVVTLRSPDSPARRARVTWERIWNHNVHTDITEVKTPLGTTQARLTIDDSDAKIEIRGYPASVHELDDEAQKWVEMLPPGSSIGDWLLGHTDPDYSARETIIPGEIGIKRIYQHHWEIEYAERDEDGNPAVIVLHPPEEDYEVEVKIVKWLNAP